MPRRIPHLRWWMGVILFASTVIKVNPARSIKRKKESSGRTRFLSDDEEPVIVAALRERFPEHVPAFLISLHGRC
jgi:hypothetical protein